MAPVLLTHPEPRDVARGADVAFTAWAGGISPLSYQWQFNQIPIAAATNATLTLSNVQPGQVGPYRLVVSNPIGSTTSQAAMLTLTNRPPVAGADAILVPRAQAAFVSIPALISNDSDPDGDNISFGSVSPTSLYGASVAVVSGQVRYTPPAAFRGSDRFTYTVVDAQGLSSACEVSVFVYAGPLPSRNLLVTAVETGSIRLSYSGGVGQICEWQRSHDLSHWETLASVSIPAHSFVEWIEPLSTASQTYYRVRQK